MARLVLKHRHRSRADCGEERSRTWRRTVGDITQEATAVEPRLIPKRTRVGSLFKGTAVMLDVLFWSISEYNIHDGSLRQEVFKVGYETGLGNASFLLDEDVLSLTRQAASCQ